MLRETIDCVDGVALLVGLDGSILDATPAALDFYGRARAEMLGLSIHNIRGARDYPDGRIHGTTCGGAQHGEVHRRGDGTPLYVEVRSVPVSVNGKAASLRLVNDIAGRKRVEEASVAHDWWLSESQRIAQVGHYALDIENDHLGGSAGLYDVLGTDESHASNLAGWIKIAHPADREVLTRHFTEDVIRRRRPFDIEYRIVRPCDGVERWVHALGSAEFHDDGRAMMMFGIIQDITEKKCTEESLRVYAELLESSPASVTVHSLQGEFLYANQRAAEIHGYTRGEFLELTQSEIEVPELAEVIAERLRRIADHGRDSFEATHYRKDGSTLPLCVNSRLALWEGRAVLLSVATDITERKRVEQDLLETNSRLEGMTRSVAEAMGRIVEVRDPYTQGHEVRVAEFAKRLAEEMGLSAHEVAGAEMSALVHDIGKLGVPVEILSKPGALSQVELQIIRQHPTAGYEILKDIAYPWPVAESVLQHHERMDGSGYPRGLHGDEICLAARIIALADAIEAMASDRPYRPALGVDAAVADIVAHREKWDPDVVAACLRLHESGQRLW